MRQNPIEDIYFNWIVGLACEWLNPYGNYEYLVEHLQERFFTWDIPNDENRAKDGMDFRYLCKNDLRISTNDIEQYLKHPCTILEMMMALAKRIEDSLMWNPDIGDRSGQWVFDMLHNSGLSKYNNRNYNEKAVNDILDNVLSHNYTFNGVGGFFYVENPSIDLRNIELWWQCNWHFNDILKGE